MSARGGLLTQRDDMFTIDKDIYLKDPQGRFRTQSLFMEYELDSFKAPYTLSNEDVEKPDGRVYKSLYKIYFEYKDPTEYSFAKAAFNSWKCWTQLSKASWFKLTVAEWRGELKALLEFERFKEMESIKDNAEGATKATAVKWLSEKYSKRTPKRGRPSKEEIASRTKQDVMEQSLIEADAQRIGILN